jgi:hypothetical protein
MVYSRNFVSQMAGTEYFLTSLRSEVRMRIDSLSLKRLFSTVPTVLSLERKYFLQLGKCAEEKTLQIAPSCSYNLVAFGDFFAVYFKDDEVFYKVEEAVFFKDAFISSLIQKLKESELPNPYALR